jgi:hypothetical protein
MVLKWTEVVGVVSIVMGLEWKVVDEDLLL